MSEDISVLGIAVETRGVKEGSDALDRLTVAGGRAEKSTNTLGAESRKTSSEIAALAKATLAAASAFGVWTSIKGIASSMIDAQQAAQKLRNSLSYAADGAAGASKEIQYLREVTTRLGMDFATSSAAYAKFAAATKDSGVSMSQTKTVFEGIAAASAKLGLSADETQGALLALSQMASKGTVSAEELRGQLGERLPGAFNLAAKSMGVTTAELGKMLQAGEVMASDFLPRFGQALKDQFQAPLNSLTQELNRFSSAWTIWKTELSDGANGGGFKWLTNGLNESSAAMHALGAEAGITQKLLMAIGGFQAGAVGTGRYDTAQVQVEKIAELKKVKAEILAMQTAEENGEIRLSKTTRNRLDVLKEEEKTIRQSLLDLAVRRGKETGLNMPDIAGEFAAQEKKKAEVLKAYLSDTDNAPKAAKVAAAVEKENAAFKIAVAAYSETDQQYQTALKAHNERLAEIQKAPKGASTTKNDASQEYAARLSEEKDFTKTQIDLIKARVEQRVISEEDGIKQVLESQTAGFAAQQATLTAQMAATSDKGDKLRIGSQLQAIANDAQTAQAAYTTAMSKMAQARTQYMQSQVEGYDNAATKVDQENSALRDQIDILGMTDQQLGEYEAAKVRVAAAAEYLAASNLREAAASLQASDATNDAIPYYLQLADAREAAGKALDQKSLLESEKGMKKAAIEADKEWKKTADKIGDNITDALMRGFESGKGFAETLRDTVVNMFSTMILRPIIQATVMGGMSAIGLGSGSALANTSSATSSLGSIGSLASGAKTAYDMFSSGASTTYTKLAESGIGQSIGLSTAQAPGYMAPVYDSTGALISEGTGTAAGGLTELGSSIGSGLATAGAGILGSAIGNAIAGDKRIISGVGMSMVGAAAGGVAGSMAMLGSVTGPLGAVLGGVLGGVIDAAFGMGEKKQGETGIKGTFTGTQFSGSTYSKWSQEGGWFRSDDGGTDQSPLDSSTTTALSNSFTMLKLETGRLAEGLGVDTAKIASYAKYVSVAFTGDATADAKALSDMIAGVSEEMSALALAGTDFGLAGETSSETLNRLYNSLTTVNQAFDAINISAYSTSLAGGDMASQLALAMGGLDAFKTSITSYYSTYFSAAEKQADLTAQVTASFAAMGVAMPSTEAGLRAIVEGLDMTTASGRATFVSVMSVEQAFAQMTAANKSLVDSAVASRASIFDALSTDDQKLSAAKSRLESGFSAIGEKIPATAAVFIGLAERADVTTAAGQSLIAALSAMEPAFATVANAAKSAVDGLYAALGTIGAERSGLLDAIFSAQLDGMDSSGQVAALKSREAELWASLDGGNLDAASTLKDTLLQRIALEATAKDAATKAQLESAQTLLDTMKSVSAFSKSMRNEFLSLSASDLSPLSYADQLAASFTLWSETLAKAKTGDATAQSSLSSVGNSYLKEAQGYYGANSDYASAFSSVAGAMDQFGNTGPTDLAISDQQIIVTNLTKATTEQTNTSKEQVVALKSIDSALARQQSATEAQLRQNGEGLTAIIAALKKIDERLQSVEASNKQAALA